jgi:glucosamine--fructose-6-phosphate aminotransferase (isomerizing)
VSTAEATLLEQEMRSQGDVLAARTPEGRRAAAEAAEVLRGADIDYLVVAARGTSDNAARYAQYLFGSVARLPVALAAPWLFGSENPPLLERAAVLAISQSGGSPDIVGVVEAARAQGRPTIAITNEPGSPLAVAAEVLVPLAAGPERSVAATKTYLASLHALAQIASCLLEPDGALEHEEWFERLPGLVTSVAAEQLATRERFDPLTASSLVTVIGRGLQFPTAFETALKIRELSGIAAEAFSPPDLLHGPIAALDGSGTVWVLSTGGRGAPDRALVGALSAGAGTTVVVSGERDLLELADIAVELPEAVPSWVAPLLAVIPAQAAALRLAELRGIDVDRPPGLSKVTLTR